MGVRIVTSPLFKIEGLVHGFSTRKGGLSRPPFDELNLGWSCGDEDEAVQKNYEILAHELDLDPDDFVWTRQVHGDKVIEVKRVQDLNDYSGVSCDSMMTQGKNLILTIRTADCLPVLFIEEQNKVVAAAHVGWRGTLSNVVGKTVKQMVETYSVNPKKIKVAVGPGISMKNYEISTGVASLFREKLQVDSNELSEKRNQHHVNLPQINGRLLEAAGIASENIWTSNLCTFEEKGMFFSYRRDGQKTGRQVGFIAWVS